MRRTKGHVRENINLPGQNVVKVKRGDEGVPRSTKPPYKGLIDMGEVMTPQERVMAALLLEEPDTVPISPMLDERFKILPQVYDTLVKTSDFLYCARVPLAPPFYTASHRAKTHMNKVVYPEYEIHRTSIETPKGLLTSISRLSRIQVSSNIFATSSSSLLKGYIEEEEDVQKFLSIPYEPCKPDPKPFFDLVKRFGNRGLVFLDSNDPICVVRSLFKLDKFYVWIFKKPYLVKALLDAVHPRIIDYIEFLLTRGVGPLFNITGPEFACTTFVAPRFFDSFVMAYDRKLIKLIHEHGQLVMVHCHGKVNDLLERFANMGADGLNPLETPSETWDSGDIDLADAKRRIGQKVCLVGSVQTGDLAIGDKKLVEQRCREAVEKAAVGGGFILIYSGGPNEAILLKTRFCQNLLHMIEAGRKYGKYPQKP